MRALPICFYAILLLSACTKEEDIPFIGADHASIKPDYYHRLQGHYVGTLSEIEFVSDTAFVINNAKAYEMDVAELDFDHVSLSNISGRIASDAVAEIGRLDAVAYIRFENGSMSDSLVIDSVYFQYYNGVYIKSDGYLEYFIRYKSNNVIIHELFQGQRN